MASRVEGMVYCATASELVTVVAEAADATAAAADWLRAVEMLNPGPEVPTPPDEGDWHP